ncbi:integral membrane protein [Metarhizium rileyi]|uniref:Integral membrane protein n=1 Tax=Metarhizium rileyi (strain RCEF 4871) TaxID=1649241 RepID=A0A166YRB5_METRR|nr:integral membrane protein [Metarhizium rileyi RCEF 4871]
MDSFARAFQKGLAKTVAVGQQQLQQRLSKYDQQNTGAHVSPGNTYGTGHQAQAQYAYGSQGSSQTEPVVNQQAYHASFFPPLPRTRQPRYQVHAQQDGQTHGHGQYTSAPSMTQSYRTSKTSAPQVGYHGHSNPPPPPPLPPRPSQQPLVNTSYPPPTLDQTTSCTPQNPNGEGYHAVAAPTELAYDTTSQQTTHTYHRPPASTATTYPPPPPLVNQQQPGNAHHGQQDHSRDMPQESSEHSINVSLAQSFTPPTTAQMNQTDQNTTTYNTTAPGETQQHHKIQPHPAAGNASRTLQIDAETGPVAGHTTPLSQYYPAAAATPSAQVFANQKVRESFENRHTYNAAITRVDKHTTTCPSGRTHDLKLANTIQRRQPLHEDPSAIARQMDNLNINIVSPSPLDTTRVPLQTSKPKLVPIVASGTPRGTIPYCTEDRLVEYSLYWYQIPETPGFLICTRCHEDHIQGTLLAGEFRRVLVDDGSASICRFWYPRVKDSLWKQALQWNSLDDLHAYATRRLAIPSCKGREATVGKDGIKYFGMRNNEIEGFITCEACYEDKIIGTAFEAKFTPRDDQGAEAKWICDTSLPYLSRALRSFAEKNDWSGFIEGATRRLQLPVCEGDSKPASEGPWYVFRRKMDNFHVCATCYMDKLELTVFEGEFDAVNQKVGFDAWMEMLGQRWTCDLTNTSLPLLVALEDGISEKNFDAFWNTAQTISRLVPCTAKGIIRGNWWTVPGACPDFNICEACYVGIFKTKKLDQFLEPATRDPEKTLICNFCPAAPRFKQFARKYLEAVDRGVFSCYADCVRKFASILPCPGINHLENAKWWGYPDALFCEDCYVSFVADTSLGAHVPIKGDFDQRAQICQVWSPRMRGMWTEACNAGEHGSSASNEQVEAFRAFGAKRLQIYLETVPRIRFIKQMREMKMMNAMHQGQLSLMYSGMNSMAVLSDTVDGNAHGNSSLGWYETEHGATGAQMFNNMQSGFADANRTDEWMEILRLQAIWAEVE